MSKVPFIQVAQWLVENGLDESQLYISIDSDRTSISCHDTLEKNPTLRRRLKRVFAPLTREGQAPSIRLEGTTKLALSGFMDEPYQVDFTWYGATSCRAVGETFDERELSEYDKALKMRELEKLQEELQTGISKVKRTLWSCDENA